MTAEVGIPELVIAGGRPWAVRERGTGAPLLVLHGFTGSGATWDDFAVPGRRVIAPDLPGHGGTPPDGPSVEAAADGLAALLRRLDAAPASVLGYSLGARVALRLAITQPTVVARLVLEAPSAGIADPAARAARRASDETRAAALELDGLAAFVAAWEREPVLAGIGALPAPAAARVRAIRLGHEPAGLAASLRASGQGAMEPLHGRLAEIVAPVLVIVGANDPARARAETVAAGIAGARLVVVPGAGHAPHLETPGVFRSAVLEFLQEDPAP